MSNSPAPAVPVPGAAQTALASLGEGPEHDQAAALIEAFTRDPAGVLADQVAASDVLADGQGRLQ